MASNVARPIANTPSTTVTTRDSDAAATATGATISTANGFCNPPVK